MELGKEIEKASYSLKEIFTKGSFEKELACRPKKFLQLKSKRIPYKTGILPKKR